MIKFCGNCGTTVSEDDISRARAIASGNYVYCNKCANKLGFSVPVSDSDIQLEGDTADTRNTQPVAARKPEPAIPSDVFKEPADEHASTQLSMGDLRKMSGIDGVKRDTTAVNTSVPSKKEVRCPSCQVKLRIAMTDKPKKVRCPKCAKVFAVRSGPEAAPAAQKPAQETAGIPFPSDEAATQPAPAVKIPSAAAQPEEDGALELLTPGTAAVPQAPAEEAPAVPPADDTSRTVPTRRSSLSSRRTGAHSSRRRRGKGTKTAQGSEASDTPDGKVKGKGLAVLLILLFIFAGAPFGLLSVTDMRPAIESIGSAVDEGLAGIGLKTAITPDVENQPEDADADEAGDGEEDGDTAAEEDQPEPAENLETDVQPEEADTPQPDNTQD